MKKLLVLTIIAIIASIIGSTPPAKATGDTGWHCPSGTVHTYKMDNLSGPTFTVPNAPSGWEVLGVSIKAGRDHYDYPDAVSGDVIQVKTDTGHDTSHAHICKQRKQWPTTTATSPSTTSTTLPATTTSVPTPTSTTTTVKPQSTTTTTTTVVGSTTTVPSSIFTTTEPESGSSTTSSTAVPGTSEPSKSTTTVLTTDTTVPTPDPARRLPATGPSDFAMMLLGVGALAIIAGALMVRRVK